MELQNRTNTEYEYRNVCTYHFFSFCFPLCEWNIGYCNANYIRSNQSNFVWHVLRRVNTGIKQQQKKRQNLFPKWRGDFNWIKLFEYSMSIYEHGQNYATYIMTINLDVVLHTKNIFKLYFCPLHQRKTPVCNRSLVWTLFLQYFN